MRFKNISIAVLSDIHGNSWALKKVLEDIRLRSPDLIINLGDSLYGPLNPSGTYELIRKSRMVSICGNEDRLIFEKESHKYKNDTLTYVRDQLSAEALNWLKSLAHQATYPDLLYACHGTPCSDNKYLIHKVINSIIVRRENSEIHNLIGDISERIILCGHSHLPSVVETCGRIIINPGSVGCPAFDDSYPEYHRVENASPRSNYCILKINSQGLKIEQISLEYAFKDAVSAAEFNNRSDWAEWLRTGLVS